AAQGKGRPPAPARPARRPRPGDEIATRHAPVSESLGAGVKQHLSQQMTERVAQEAQQRLQSRVEQKVEQDLGPAAKPAATPAPPADRSARFASLLRNPASLQQAIVVNLILSPPASMRRLPRR